MENKDLMAPRYEVIADYPDSPFKEGQILTTRNGGSSGQVIDVYMSAGNDLIIRVDNYPHLFRPLQWWEKRSVEDMPEYVSYFGVVNKGVWNAMGWFRPLDGSLVMNVHEVLPATLEQYIAHNTTLTT